MASKIGQHRTLQIFVFQKYRAPSVVGTAIRQIAAESIRVVEAAVCILIGRRVGVGHTFLIGGQGQSVLAIPALERLPEAAIRARKLKRSFRDIIICRCALRNSPSECFSSKRETSTIADSVAYGFRPTASSGTLDIPVAIWDPLVSCRSRKICISLHRISFSSIHHGYGSHRHGRGLL